MSPRKTTGQVVDTGDAELVGGNATEKGYVTAAGLVPGVVEPAGSQGGEGGVECAGSGGDDRDWLAGGDGGEGGGVARLDGAVVRDGEAEAGIVDAVQRFEAFIDIVGERVGTVGRGVLESDLGGLQRIESRGDLGARSLGEAGGGDERADTENGAQCGQQCPDWAMTDGCCGLGDCVGETESGRVASVTHERRRLR